MGDKLAVLFLGSAWYSDVEETLSDLEARRFGTSEGFSASIGFRRIINPGGKVEVSFLLLLGGESNWSESNWSEATSEETEDDSESSHTTHEYALGASIGLILEYKFTDWLALRIDSMLVRVSYSVGEWDWRDADEDPSPSRREDFHAKLIFSPSVQLRMSF
jgi:hypothetical protein